MINPVNSIDCIALNGMTILQYKKLNALIHIFDIECPNILYILSQKASRHI
jgi:hypothetical protein